MNKLLINKYQPKYLEEFNFDKNFINLLENFIKSNNLNILLIGNIGSGKTTLINSLLYKYYNVSKLSKIANNVLYINNLKEQGISFYRNDVKIFCQSTSEIKNKKKTIILDDIDTLNEQNQQIFKIQMDNYISNVNFICSCNNINKLNLGLQSYLIPIKLKNIDSNYLLNILKKICLTENLIFTDDQKHDIITFSNNSIKLLINNLEKFKILQNTEMNFEIKYINNNLLINNFNNYYNLCLIKNTHGAYKILLNIFDDGYSIIDIIDYMYNYFKINNKIEAKIKYLLIQIISKYIINTNNHNEEILVLYFLTTDIISII